MEKAIKHIAYQIKKYREASVTDGNNLNEILKQISATLFYLETERAKYHNAFQNRIADLVLKGDSVSRAENTAHVENPELYMLRRIMDSAYEVIGAIRTNISYLKKEINESRN